MHGRAKERTGQTHGRMDVERGGPLYTFAGDLSISAFAKGSKGEDGVGDDAKGSKGEDVD